MVITDATQPGHPIVYVNPAFSELFGYTAAEVVGLNCRFVQGRNTDKSTVAEINAALKSGRSIRREILNYRKDGTSFWNDLVIDPIHDATGRVTGFVSSQVEVSAFHAAVEQKAKADARLRHIVDNIPGYVYRRVMRANGDIEITYSSPSLRKLLGEVDPENAGPFYNRVHPDDLESLIATIRQSAAEMSVFNEEFRLVSTSGVVHWFRSIASPQAAEDGEIVWDGVAIEISAEKHWQNEIAKLALRDPLTGLLSREAWRQALSVQLGASSNERRRCALLRIDVAEFHKLNKTVGEVVGDGVLIETGKRIVAAVAAVGGVAARLGGDEFVVLYPTCPPGRALLSLVKAAGQAIAQPMEIAGRRLFVRARIGATLHEGQHGSKDQPDAVAQELMLQTEIALRSAKMAGSGDCAFYSPTLDDRFRDQSEFVKDVEAALKNNELELYYQPLVDIASGTLVGAEALIRWQHPKLGLRRPDLFIPLAEKSGCIVQLGRWVFHQAVRQRRSWQIAGLPVPPIAINVSSSQLNDPEFIHIVMDVLVAEQASARDFELELTESQLIEATPQVLATLHALRTLGFAISIDDFGSGHATFRYLSDFPVDKIKIDRLFIQRLALRANDALIVRAILLLARSMGIGFVAEGIETEAQRKFLLSEGCEIGQGYLFSPPIPAEKFAEILGIAA